MERLRDIKPKIKTLKFENKGKIDIHLEDGRIIIVPLSCFPSIKKLSANQRKKWQVLDHIGFTFDDTDDLFHLYEIIGKVEPPCC